MKVLLDTNICIALMRGNEKAATRMAALAPEDCVVSVITVYELFTGVAKCREPERERAKVLRLLSSLRSVAFDEAAAKRAAQVRADLEKSGQTCGPYDLLLAGHARALGVGIATHNVAEFSRVDGLPVEDWLA